MSSELSSDNEMFIQQQVALGAYPDRDSAIDAGVELLRRRKRLMDRLAESRRQLDEGEYEEYDQEGLRQLFVELIARAESGNGQQ